MKDERIGEKHITNEGYEIEIIDYKGADNCTIKFHDGTIIYNKGYNAICKGSIHKPVDLVGETSFSTCGSKMTIIEYYSFCNCTIIFDTGNIKKNVQYDAFKKGFVKNPMFPSVYGVGYLGEGVNTKLKTHKKNYNTWKCMLYRSYVDEYATKNPTYKDVTVCDEWHNFQNFNEWMLKNYNPDVMIGWELDKDILCKECKQYSTETCVFVPKEINMFFIRKDMSKNAVVKVGGKFSVNLYKYNKCRYLGTYLTEDEAQYVYKKEFNNYIIEIANKWKGLVDDRVYDKLLNYKKC